MDLDKKPLSTKVRMIISVSTLIVVLLAFNQCVMQPNSKNSKSSSTKKLVNSGNEGRPVDFIAPTGDAGDMRPDVVRLPANANMPTTSTPDVVMLPPGVDMPAMNAPLTDAQLEGLAVGVKNFDQINQTMSQLTGVPTTDTKVRNMFNESAMNLSSDNSVQTFAPSMQVAITKLATEYCSVLVDTDLKRKLIWPTINFTQGPNMTFTVGNKALLIDETIRNFLGPLDAASITQVRTELIALYGEMIAGEVMTSAETTKKVAKAICTASLSSAYVSLL